MKTKRYHIIIDVADAPNEVLNDVEGLKKFLNDLPPLIDMHALTQPMVIAGVPENPGITGFVIIDYSHISAHTFTNNGEALVDIFSCKPYEQETAVKATLDYFKVDRDKARIQVVCWG